MSAVLHISPTATIPFFIACNESKNNNEVIELNSEIDSIKLKYDFVNLYVNGEDLGLYVIEEFFSKQLLERNKRRDGPIFSVQENFETDFKNTKFEV